MAEELADPRDRSLPAASREADSELPVDPDVELGPRPPSQLAAAAAVGAGGVFGSLMRYQLGLIWPTPPAAFPAVTLLINVIGSLLIGIVVAVATEHARGHPLVRPFAGTGVLGGFTTFSTFAVDGHGLFAAGQPVLAVVYLAGTALAAVLAAWFGLTLGRRVGHRGRVEQP